MSKVKIMPKNETIIRSLRESLDKAIEEDEERGCPFCPDDPKVKLEQAKRYGGWCEHWCAKCGYDCVWEDFNAGRKEPTMASRLTPSDSGILLNRMAAQLKILLFMIESFKEKTPDMNHGNDLVTIHMSIRKILAWRTLDGS